MKKTQADFVLYLYCEGQIDSVSDSEVPQWKAAIIDIFNLREWVSTRRFPVKSVPNKNYFAYGYIIPRKTLLKELPDAYIECKLSELGLKVSEIMFKWLFKSS